ncbi:flocculation protein FLO11-like [Aricia agestis]|uniref:flocculation protein FLO11-like n=1 Tax=Aricia agestis TaxID=91739 RepID=UPI001C20C162|nr:flocculation protein FLO11-like [Aricia agestis]
MNKRLLFTFLLIFYLTINADTKKLSRSRSSSSSRGSSRKTNSYPQPAPTSLSKPQASAPKPTLFGWQEKPAQKTQTYSSKQSKPRTSEHSYPSSNTGLSGNNQPKKSTYEENVQRSNAPVQQSVPSSNNQMSHSYPASKGLSGDSSPGSGYPQGSGLSGQGTNLNANRPQSPYPSSNGLSGHSSSNMGHGQVQGMPNTNVAPPPYQANNPGNSYRAPGNGGYSNVNNQYQGAPSPYSSGNHYNHPQGPPPPYNSGHNNYGGYGNPGSSGAQMPGYFGNYNSGKGFGGVGRSGSTLAGVGLAGAGIGTVLTGLALWNLARSTGHHHHTVIYDNRGQPIAVAPDNSTVPVVDPILGDLVNCTLTITNDEKSEVLAIPCSIATSFTPDADVKDLGVDSNTNNKTKCIITVVTKSEKEFMTTIPCSILLNTAAENNVTEPIIDQTANVTDIIISTTTDVVLTPNQLLAADQPLNLNKSQDIPDEPKLDTNNNCSPEPGEKRDPINPCFGINHNLTVIPLETSTNDTNNN